MKVLQEHSGEAPFAIICDGLDALPDFLQFANLCVKEYEEVIEVEKLQYEKLTPDFVYEKVGKIFGLTKLGLTAI